MPRTKDSAPVDPRVKAQKELDVCNRRIERLRAKHEKATQEALSTKAALDYELSRQSYLSQHPALKGDGSQAEAVDEVLADADEDTDDEPM